MAKTTGKKTEKKTEQKSKKKQLKQQSLPKQPKQPKQSKQHKRPKADLVGKFIGNERGFGFVHRKNGADIFIPPHLVHGALNGDEVAYKEDIPEYDSEGKIRHSGRVTEIRHRLPMVGTFSTDNGWGYVSPVDKKIPYVFLVSRKTISRFDLVDGHRVVFSVDKRHRTDKEIASCFITDVIGHSNDPGMDVLTLVLSAGVPHEFSDDVMAEAAALPTEVTAEAVAPFDRIGNDNGMGHHDMTEETGTERLCRLDLRNEVIITIDGDDTKDIDDAVSFAVLPEGRFRLGVHIADVTHYVRENSALDESALVRGTSIYLADRVIPMLPHKLSSGICSLFPDVDRLTLSCIMTVNANGHVEDYAITPSIIRSKKRWTYQAVQDLLDSSTDSETESDTLHFEHSGTELKSELKSDLEAENFDWLAHFKGMDTLREILREKRAQRGALDFDLPESKIRVDEEGRPISIESYPRSRATGIIEEFMILCNETIAAHFFEKKIPFVYRTHEPPSTEKLAGVRMLAKTLGFSNAGFSLQHLLAAAQDTSSANAISMAVLQSLPQAHYSHDDPAHFGLASTAYCHFTSPIRRYADLQIHRLIKHAIGFDSAPDISSLPAICTQCSRTERTAEALEREVAELKKVQFMANKEGHTFDATVSGVTSWGIYITLENTVEGLVPIANLRTHGYSFDKERNTYECKRHGSEPAKTLQHGSSVNVRLMRVNEDERKLTFALN